MIFNIPGTATGLPGGVPANAKLEDGAINAKNLRGGVGYMGPGAPPAGPYHHYTFELFALDTKLDLGPDATRAEVLAAMQGHILGKGVLEGRFHQAVTGTALEADGMPDDAVRACCNCAATTFQTARARN